MPETFHASAPGRLDVMGGVADYSGSLLLQLAIPELTHVQLTRTGGDVIELVSAQQPSARPVRVPLHWLGAPAVVRGDYDGFRQNVRSLGHGDWPLYVLGSWLQLARVRSLPLEGLRFAVNSEVPVGAGLSSSAALEVATLRVLAQAYRLTLGGIELAVLAQAAENEVVGAPCGLMDQLASHLGDTAHLLAFRCVPQARLLQPIALPPGIRFARHDSGVGHRVSGDAYGRARCAAFMGKRILQQDYGMALRGVLAAVPTMQFRERVLPHLPGELRGADFLREYARTDDELTAVEPDVMYPVRAATAHPVLEQERIAAFADVLRAANDSRRPLTEAEKQQLGYRMHRSHLSYTAIGLGHARTDQLVAELNERPGVHGARVTGGGLGGTVVALEDA